MKRQDFLFISLSVASLIATLLLVGTDQDTQELTPEQLTLRHNLSSLAIQPDWSELENYQQTISRQEFVDQLNRIYSEGEAWRSVVKINEQYADIRSTGKKRLRLHFAKEKSPQKPKRYWRAANELPRAHDLKEKPLSKLRIAIDPGHIGGQWAKMENRWYKGNNVGVYVKEGELTLATAKVLKLKLEMLGAKVWLIRDKLEPVTKLRPKDFESLAIQILKKRGEQPIGSSLLKVSQPLFFRAHEIRRRAQLINSEIKPDITLCLHYNAEPWGNSYKPQLVTSNHLHLLLNGNYSYGEFQLEDNRFHLFKRLLQRTHDEELPLNLTIAEAMAKETGLPPYNYTTTNAKHVDQNNSYVYARNLLATRLYHNPVVFIEPYVMNNHEVYQRIEEGDYHGKRKISGKLRKSLIREYADGVAEGLRRYYSKVRRY